MGRGMYWIRNIYRLESREAHSTLEYILGSESNIAGILHYANSALLCGGCVSAPPPDGLHKYLLKIKHPHSNPEGASTSPTRDGYALREGAIGELSSILSLALNTRFLFYQRLMEI